MENTEKVLNKMESKVSPKKVKEEQEYDLVQSLLKAAEFKTSDDTIQEVEIKRAGQYLFSVHIHPISEKDARFARKKATSTMPNPAGKKYPPIEKETDLAAFSSWIIYIATTEEDQAKIWGNSAVMSAHGLVQAWESVDVLLTYGEKNALAEQVYKISGLNEDDDYDEDEDETGEDDYIKN